MLFEVGDMVEIVSDSHDTEERIFYGSKAEVIDKKADNWGFSLRLEFEDGYQTWMPSEDCVMY